MNALEHPAPHPANLGLLKKLPAKRFDASQETGAQEARLSAMQ
jgi:hypothetical protein